MEAIFFYIKVISVEECALVTIVSIVMSSYMSDIRQLWQTMVCARVNR